MGRDSGFEKDPINWDKFKAPVIVICLLIAGYVYCCWELGNRARSFYDNFLEHYGVNDLGGNSDEWRRGFFSSKHSVLWTVGAERSLELVTVVNHMPSLRDSQIHIFDLVSTLNLNDEPIARVVTHEFLNGDRNASVVIAQSPERDVLSLPISFQSGARLDYSYREARHTAKIELEIPEVTVKYPEFDFRATNVLVRGEHSRFDVKSFQQDITVSFNDLATNIEVLDYGPLTIPGASLTMDLKFSPIKLLATWEDYEDAWQRKLTLDHIKKYREMIRGTLEGEIDTEEGLLKINYASKGKDLDLELEVDHKLVKRAIPRRYQGRIYHLIRTKRLESKGDYIRGELSSRRGRTYLGEYKFTPIPIP